MNYKTKPMVSAQSVIKNFMYVISTNIQYNCSKCTAKRLIWANFETSFQTLKHIFEEYKEKKDVEIQNLKTSISQTNLNQETEQISQNIEDIMKSFGKDNKDLQKFKAIYVHLELRLEASVECVIEEFKRLQENPIRYLYEKDDVSSILLDLYEKSKFNSELHKKMELLLSTCDDIGQLSKFDGSERIYFQKK